MRKGNRVVSSHTSTKAIRKVVKEYADQIGIEIAPYDLRRTYAKLAARVAHRSNRSRFPWGISRSTPLEQIQIALGHQSLNTTQKYLGTDLDHAQAACDYIGIHFLAK